ncbi:MAG: monovalent cation/H(+) antiporter subunit G [Clostridia bacterium]|nr:monovalent cation/H(+) antiporter subunit G [Clostridia bacterium]
METVRFIISAVLMAGALFTFITGVLGAFRFRYVLNRMHAAAVNDTLGVLLAIAALVIAFGFTMTSLKLILIIIFLWLSSPVSSHLIARLEVTTSPDLKQEMEDRRK